MTDIKIDLDFLIDDSIQSINCSGIFYKGRTNIFQNARGDIVNKQTLSLMKRKSCQGCEVCHGTHDLLSTRLSEIVDGLEIEKDAIYELQWFLSSSHYEYGDEYDLHFVKVENKAP